MQYQDIEVKTPIPAGLATCRGEPAIPTDEALLAPDGDKVAGAYLAALWAAQDDCRGKLGDLVKAMTP